MKKSQVERKRKRKRKRCKQRTWWLLALVRTTVNWIGRLTWSRLQTSSVRNNLHKAQTRCNKKKVKLFPWFRWMIVHEVGEGKIHKGLGGVDFLFFLGFSSQHTNFMCKLNCSLLMSLTKSLFLTSPLQTARSAISMRVLLNARHWRLSHTAVR